MTYRGFSGAKLEQEYSPSSMMEEDLSVFLQRYVDESKKARAQHPVQEMLRYGDHEDETLDYFPCSLPDAPLHVFIHGGYWQQLSHREAASMAPSILSAGSNFATLNYTIAPAGHIRDMVDQCARAVIWLKGQAAELGFDPKRIVISGHSAGAQLAAMLINDLDGVFAQNHVTIESAILISGIYDLEPIRFTSVDKPLNLTEQDVRALSPMNFKPAVCSKAKVVVAQNDTAEFVRQSKEYYAHLKSNGIQGSLEIVQDYHHFDIILRPETFEHP
ncbi:alpha/beta hydrolase [Sulfitobacter sp. F26204]|uniref:alpha/beta hydrolase n=1 Tax=Sulfitobacter sp. F26204 TaxID=2996014 RepID=UPI00225E3D35|nr:alpha/beta hydrolase [Sulfitobacter sp. F26204]MCX7561746.1 alpha/beta hydrolase [Sulfitobacter sp. F26204]